MSSLVFPVECFSCLPYIRSRTGEDVLTAVPPPGGRGPPGGELRAQGQFLSGLQLSTPSSYRGESIYADSLAES